MSRDWIDKLCDQVHQSTDFNVLARIMPHVGVNVQDIQNLMKEKIQELDSVAAKRAAFNVLPMQSILPKDAVQHVLSFQHYSRMRRVSKSFKKCYDTNQEIAKRSRQKFADDHAHLFSPNINYDESTNQTFVLCRDGDSLTEGVKSYGQVTPWNGNLVDLIERQCKSGDRILVQDGTYELPRFHCSNKALQIIGIGESITIEVTDPMGLRITGASRVLFRNINVVFQNALVYGIQVEALSKLWMEKCILTSSQSPHKIISISSTGRSVVSVKDCVFIDYVIGLMLDDLEGCGNIIGCVFQGCNSCISTKGAIHCIGNYFIDNGRVVRLLQDDQSKEKSLFLGNVFQGRNNEFDWLNSRHLERERIETV